MLNEISSCCFTGHRPKSFSFGFDESTDEFLKLRAKIKNTIIQVCNQGCRVFFCGMAEGVDLWCGEIVLELADRFDPPLKIIPVVPFLAQPNSMTKKNQERYVRIMEASDERFLVSRAFTKFCYKKRNQFMVDSADSVIAVYKDSEAFSGTGQTLRYAEKKKKRIFIIKG